jgi:hypothetical protein
MSTTALRQQRFDLAVPGAPKQTWFHHGTEFNEMKETIRNSIAIGPTLHRMCSSDECLLSREFTKNNHD